MEKFGIAPLRKKEFAVKIYRILAPIIFALAGQLSVQTAFAADPVVIPLPQPIDLKPNAVYNLISRHSGLCLDVKDHGTANGVTLQQWACTGEGHQKFRIVVQFDGSYTLQGVPSGRFITVANASQENGTPIIIRDNQNSLNQKFAFYPSGEGSYMARFNHSQKCMDVSGPSTANGAVVHQWECLNAPNQQWAFREVQGPIGDDGIYTLKSRRSGKCLDVFDHGLASGVRLQQWACTGEQQQKFRLKKYNDGSFAMIAAHSSKTVTVPGYSTADGAAVVQADDIGGSNQRIRLYSSVNGTYTVRFGHSYKCLDVSDLSYADGAVVHQWQCVGGDNQDWILTKQ